MHRAFKAYSLLLKKKQNIGLTSEQHLPPAAAIITVTQGGYFEWV